MSVVTEDEINNSTVQQCVKNIINNEGFIKYSVENKVFTPDGGNFLGVLYEVNIKGETETKKEERNLFLKIIVPGEKLTLFSLPDIYKRELFVYSELSKIYEELQDEVCLPKRDRYQFIKSYSESNPGVIVLENMLKKGFRTKFRMDCITLQYAEIVVKELAKFHGLSFVLKARRPKYFEERIKTLNHPFNFNEDWNGFVQNMCQITLNYLVGDTRRKFEDFVLTFVERYAKHLDGKSGRDVLCHGDYRPNNILIKENNEEITDAIPIDYQLIYYGCPVMDFIYLIFPATDQNFRRNHLPYLKDLYHNTLKNFLNYFYLNIDDVYPKKEFEEHLKERLDYGLMIAVNLVPLLMVKQNDIPDIARGSLTELHLNLDDKCRDRMVGVVNDFIEWGYL